MNIQFDKIKFFESFLEIIEKLDFNDKRRGEANLKNDFLSRNEFN